MGKSTISMAIFNSKLLNDQRVAFLVFSSTNSQEVDAPLSEVGQLSDLILS